MNNKETVRKIFFGQSLCDEDGSQHDGGHKCIVTGRDVLSIRSLLLLTTGGAPPQADIISTLKRYTFRDNPVSL